MFPVGLLLQRNGSKSLCFPLMNRVHLAFGKKIAMVMNTGSMRSPKWIRSMHFLKMLRCTNNRKIYILLQSNDIWETMAFGSNYDFRTQYILPWVSNYFPHPVSSRMFVTRLPVYEILVSWKVLWYTSNPGEGKKFDTHGNIAPYFRKNLLRKKSCVE